MVVTQHKPQYLSVSGLVVKFVVAIDEPGVRFPPNAIHFYFFPRNCGVLSSGNRLRQIIFI